MKITFLGTSAMIPTKERNHPGMVVAYGKENMLFDCGEGIQRQLRIAKIAPPKITKLFITHWHGDHYFGIPGLFENMARNDFKDVLEVYGPKGTAVMMKKLMDTFNLRRKIKIKIIEVKKDGIVYKGKDFAVHAKYLDHNTPCLGFAVIEHDRRKMNMEYIKKLKLPQGPLLGKLQKGKDIKFKGKKVRWERATIEVPGKKVVYLTDTEMCNQAVTLAKNADVLVCESTFNESMQKTAKQYKHLTTKDAGTIARKANVKQLVTTHFSQRYNNVKPLEKEVKKYFKNSIAAKDFLVIKV